jgi:hypothetical protein
LEKVDFLGDKSSARHGCACLQEDGASRLIRFGGPHSELQEVDPR